MRRAPTVLRAGLGTRGRVILFVDLLAGIVVGVVVAVVAVVRASATWGVIRAGFLIAAPASPDVGSASAFGVTAGGGVAGCFVFGATGSAAGALEVRTAAAAALIVHHAPLGVAAEGGGSRGRRPGLGRAAGSAGLGGTSLANGLGKLEPKRLAGVRFGFRRLGLPSGGSGGGRAAGSGLWRGGGGGCRALRWVTVVAWRLWAGIRACPRFQKTRIQIRPPKNTQKPHGNCMCLHEPLGDWHRIRPRLHRLREGRAVASSCAR